MSLIPGVGAKPRCCGKKNPLEKLAYKFVDAVSLYKPASDTAQSVASISPVVNVPSVYLTF